MSRKCELSGRSAGTGNNVSHANNKTRRRFEVNLQDVSLHSGTLGRAVKLRIANRTLRTITKLGGVDAYLRKTPEAKLTPEAKRLKKRIVKAETSRRKSAAVTA